MNYEEYGGSNSEKKLQEIYYFSVLIINTFLIKKSFILWNSKSDWQIYNVHEKYTMFTSKIWVAIYIFSLSRFQEYQIFHFIKWQSWDMVLDDHIVLSIVQECEIFPGISSNGKVKI